MLTKYLLLLALAQTEGWPGETVRLELTVSGDAGWPDQTTARITFDHAAEVATGRSRADGRDVTVLRHELDGGLTALHRVVDSASGWNRIDTELWFNLGDAWPGGPLANRYSISLGAVPVDLEDGNEVFLFSDDFEDGAVARWRVLRSTVGVPIRAVDAGAHRGNFAMVNRPTGPGAFQLSAMLPRELPLDVILDTWVFMDDPPRAQWGWFLRTNAVRDDSYNFGPDTSAGNWRVGQRLAGSYTRYPGVIPFSASPAGQWLRVTFGVQGNALFTCVNTQCLDGGVIAATTFDDAGIGFGRILLSDDNDGGRAVLFDDVSVRRLVLPEPAVRIQARRFGLGQSCLNDAACISTRCSGVCVEPPAPDAGAPDAGEPAEGSPDGGVTPENPGEYAVGCGCSGAPGAGFGLMLLAFALFRRR